MKKKEQKKETEKKEEEKSEAKKPKKEKVIYYDDGSTVVDMSAGKHIAPRSKATFREKWRTYITVVKRLFPYMLCTLAALTLVYLLLLAVAGRL